MTVEALLRALGLRETTMQVKTSEHIGDHSLFSRDQEDLYSIVKTGVGREVNAVFLTHAEVKALVEAFRGPVVHFTADQVFNLANWLTDDGPDDLRALFVLADVRDQRDIVLQAEQKEALINYLKHLRVFLPCEDTIEDILMELEA